MNKSLVLLIVSLLAIGYVMAQGQGGQNDATIVDTDVDTGAIDAGMDVTGSGSVDAGQNADVNAGLNADVETQNMGENSEIRTQLQTQENNPGNGEMNQQQVRAEEGYKVMTNNKGEAMQLKSENGFGLKVGNAEAKSSLELKSEDAADGAKIKATLSNGRNAEIKVMPSTASETAIARLGLVNCVAEEGCTIELKEVGKGDEAAPVYEVEAETEGKFLGLFKTRAKVKTQVNAETGEVLRIKKPFLTSVKTVEE